MVELGELGLKTPEPTVLTTNFKPDKMLLS